MCNKTRWVQIIGSQRIALNVNINNSTYCDCFWDHHIPKETKKIEIKQLYHNK